MLKSFCKKPLLKYPVICRNFSTLYKIDGIQPADFAHLKSAQITALPNGFRVASIKIPSNRHTASISVNINAGSRCETEKNNGAAHFLEHLSFKGTKRRTRIQLEREVENIGGHLNAYTSRDETAYMSSVMRDDVPQAVDILADILLESKLDPHSIELERNTILQETVEVYKDPQEYVFDYLHETAYMKNPLGMTILGPEKNIKTLKQNDLKEYIKKYYTPNRMVLVGTGAVDHAQLVKLASEKFGHLKSPQNETSLFAPSRFTGGDYRERQDNFDLAHFAIAYPTCGWLDPDTFSLIVMHALLGSWKDTDLHGSHSNSRLISTVSAYRYAEKIMPFNTIYSDTGLFGIYVSAYEGRVTEVANCIMTSLRELVDYTTEEQVEEVKNKMATSAMSEMTNTGRLCEDVGRQVLNYGRHVAPAEFIARLNAVDAAAVKAAARRFFYDKDHALAAVGPIVELPYYTWFRRRSYSLVN